MYKAKHHHRVSGFFVVICGVIGLTSIVSTMQVFAVTAQQRTQVVLPAVVDTIEEEPSAAQAPFSFEIVSAEQQTIFENFPAEVNQPLTYLTIESHSDEALELFDIDLDVQTNMPYKGAVTLGHGDAESTIGLRVVDTERATHVNIPVVRGIVLPPHSSIIVAVAADNIPALGEQLYDGLTFDIAVNAIGWRVVAAEDNQIMRAPIEFSAPTVLFRPAR